MSCGAAAACTDVLPSLRGSGLTKRNKYMSKGEQTRDRILARSVQLFNRQGYSGASLTDIMRETGLEKGGIYNHFSSKEQLALEAFDYAYALVQQRMRHSLADKLNAIERLLAIVSVFQDLVEDP